MLHQIIVALKGNNASADGAELHEINYYMCKFSVINSIEACKIHCELNYMLFSLSFSTWKLLYHILSQVKKW